MARLWIGLIEVTHAPGCICAEARGGDGAFGIGVVRSKSRIDAEIDFARVLLAMGLILLRVHRLMPITNLASLRTAPAELMLLSGVADGSPLPLFDTFFSWNRESKHGKSLARRAARNRLSLAISAADRPAREDLPACRSQRLPRQ